MESKVDTFEVPHSSAKYLVRVTSDGNWVAYPYLSNQPDTSVPLTKISELPRKIRQTVQHYIDKCISDFEANGTLKLPNKKING